MTAEAWRSRFDRSDAPKVFPAGTSPNHTFRAEEMTRTANPKPLDEPLNQRRAENLAGSVPPFGRRHQFLCDVPIPEWRNRITQVAWPSLNHLVPRLPQPHRIRKRRSRFSCQLDLLFSPS